MDAQYICIVLITYGAVVARIPMLSHVLKGASDAAASSLPASVALGYRSHTPSVQLNEDVQPTRYVYGVPVNGLDLVNSILHVQQHGRGQVSEDQCSEESSYGPPGAGIHMQNGLSADRGGVTGERGWGCHQTDRSPGNQ